MKEIKFRAWDVKDKIMKFFDFYNIHCGVYHPSHWRDSTGLACELDDTARYPNELMQYTGHRDKNGKEIYEGDIVKYTRYGWRCVGHPQDNTDLITYYKVIWDEKDCSFKADNKNMTGSLCFEDSRAKRNEIEVIGNIYENPELLEK